MKVAGIISFYLFSHLLLDTFSQGCFLLHPFYGKLLNIAIGLGYESNSFSILCKITLEEGIQQIPKKMSIVSSEDIATIILIIIMFIVLIVNKHKDINIRKYINK
jgi:hypothetical protein